MLIELNRDDLESLLKGTCPYFSVVHHPLIERAGEMRGKFGPDWSWNNSLSEFSDSEIYEMYKICKESWKNSDSYQVESTEILPVTIQPMSRQFPDLLDERHALMMMRDIPIAIDLSVFGDSEHD